MTPNTGGPAFPLAASTGDPRDGVHCQNGMTLLDWMAGQALAGYTSRQSLAGLNVAACCYDQAESMLAEKARREATGKDGLQVDDHSPDAGKIAALEALNRELVWALDIVMFGWVDTYDDNEEVVKARAILAKARGVV